MDAGYASPFDIRVSTKKKKAWKWTMDHGESQVQRTLKCPAPLLCVAVCFLCYPHKIILDYATISLAYNEHQIPIQLVL